MSSDILKDRKVFSTSLDIVSVLFFLARKKVLYAAGVESVKDVLIFSKLGEAVFMRSW